VISFLIHPPSNKTNTAKEERHETMAKTEKSKKKAGKSGEQDGNDSVSSETKNKEQVNFHRGKWTPEGMLRTHQLVLIPFRIRAAPNRPAVEP
jgi:hypothetical protein